MQKRTWPLKRRLEVEWADSASQGRWASVSDYLARRHVGPIRSVGYLIADKDGMLSLAQSQSSANQDIADVITIPRKAVLKIRRLTGGC